ncbi:hypothetical protein Tco_1408822, partial [Tanacetum coccineum]
DFQDSPGDEEDTRSSHEYLNDLEEEYQARSLQGYFAKNCFSKIAVPSCQSPFQPELLNSSEHKPELRYTKNFEAKYNKVKAKLALLSSSALAPKSSSGLNKGLIAETYEWDEEVSSDDNEVTEVKALMVLTTEERVSLGKESASNGEWVKISIQKVHTLLELKDNDDIKSFLDYLCIDLNYVEEQRNNLLSKHRNLVQELNTCKEQLLVIKQAKLDLLTIQNTEILKENQNLRNELKELTSITETWLNSSNKVNQCISEQIPTQNKKILGIDQLTKDTSSYGPKDLIFVKSLADNSNMSITNSNKPRLSKAEDSTLPNHDTGKVPSDESQRNTIDPLVDVSDSSATDYDSADESSVCSTSLPPLEKLAGAKPISGPKTIKSILKSNSTFKAETLKGVIINEPSSAPAKGNKSTSVSKTNSTHVGKLKNVKIEDDLPFTIVPLNALQNKYKTQFKMNCELYRQNNHLSENCYHVLFCKKCKRTDQRTCDHAEFMSSIKINQHHTGKVNLPQDLDRQGHYDHDTHGHNKIISLRRGIKPKNPQHVTKNFETYGSNVHTTTDHNDIEWFRKREALQAKKAETFKKSKNETSSALRSKTPTKSEERKIKQSERGISINQEKYVKDLLRKYDINGSSVKTSIVPPNKLGPDLNGKAANETQYRGMIGSLMYLTASKPNIQFSSCLGARYQANPKESYLITIKRIFRMQHGQEKHVDKLNATYLCNLSSNIQ